MKLSFFAAVTSLAVLGGLACESGASGKSAKKTAAPATIPVDAEHEAASLSDDEVKQQVTTYLGSIDTPLTADRWKALGPRGAAQLQAIMVDPAVLPTRRSHAIDGLAAMEWKEAAAPVLGVASNEAEIPGVRFAAVRALAALMPDSSGDVALTKLLTQAQDVRVRSLAGEALARRTGGCETVKRQVTAESSENRAMFERGLKQCGELPSANVPATTK